MNIKALPQINRSREIPLYSQVASVLEKLIETGTFSKSERLPPEEDLADHFGVSRPTINKAIALLLRKNLIRRDRGRGTFVRGEEAQFTFMHDLTSFYLAMKRSHIEFETIILALERQSVSEAVAERLLLDDNEDVYYIKRLRLIGGEPIMLSEVYLPVRLFPNLEKKNLVDNSLYDIMEQKYHIPVIKTERFARAIRALEDESMAFRISLGEPLLKMDEIAYSRSNRRVAYLDNRFRGDKAVFHSVLYRRKKNDTNGGEHERRD